MRNNYALAAGIICLFSALLHTVGGQITLVNPLLDTGLSTQEKTEWLGAWHLITVMLWVFGYLLFRNGLNFRSADRSLLQIIATLSLLFAFTFIAVSFWQWQHAPQYILFLPIALLTYLGLKKQAIT